MYSCHVKGIIPGIFSITSSEKSWGVHGFCKNDGNCEDLRFSYIDWKVSTFQNKTKTFWPPEEEG